MDTYQYRTTRNIDCELFRKNLYSYLNKETIYLGEDHMKNPKRTITYNLKDGIGICSLMMYDEENQKNIEYIQIDLSTDSNDSDYLGGLQKIIESIAIDSKEVI